MRETQGMDEEATGAGGQQIEVSGDAAIIADAIAQGLGAIADGMRLIAKELAGSEDSGVEDFAETYLDGTRK